MNDDEKTLFSRPFDTHWDGVLYITHFLRRLSFLKTCVEDQEYYDSTPPFVFGICENYVFPICKQVGEFHDAVVVYKKFQHAETKDSSHTKKTHKTCHNNEILTDLPIDIWSCITPYLQITDWRHLTHASQTLRNKVTNPLFISNTHFHSLDDLDTKISHDDTAYNEDDIYINPNIWCSLWYNRRYQMLHSIRLYQKKTTKRFSTLLLQPTTAKKEEEVLELQKRQDITFSIDFHNSKKVRIDWHECMDRKLYPFTCSLELSVTPSNMFGIEKGHYASYIYWNIYGYGFCKCNPFRYSTTALPLSVYTHRQEAIRIEVNEYCSAFSIFFETYHVCGYLAIRKRHTKDCTCQTQQQHIDLHSRDTTFVIGTQKQDVFVDGIEVRPLNTSCRIRERWKYISFDALKKDEITKFSWFWPWYYRNDLSLLAPFRIQNKSKLLDAQIVIANRKIYNYKYHFELIFSPNK
jgi:hypothetical protein